MTTGAGSVDHFIGCAANIGRHAHRDTARHSSRFGSLLGNTSGSFSEPS
jgi:hypothetical protein